MYNSLHNHIKSLYDEEIRLKSELNYWQSYEPINNIGKFARQTRIDTISDRLSEIIDAVEIKKIFNILDILKFKK